MNLESIWLLNLLKTIFLLWKQSNNKFESTELEIYNVWKSSETGMVDEEAVLLVV